MSMDLATQSSSYDGNCHCGHYRFRVAVPKTVSAIACTCVICSKKGILWLVTLAEPLVITRDDGYLMEHQSGVLKHKFCNKCGTPVSGEHLVGPMSGQFAVNIRTFHGVNPFELEKSGTISTIHIDDKEAPAAPTPSDPSVQHMGSCYCGTVKAEVLCPVSTQEVKEDNCSMCVRTAWVGIYPDKDQVRIYGRERTSEYRWGTKYGGSPFCMTCGVFVFGNLYGPPQSFIYGIPAERKEAFMKIYHRNMRIQPVNVRTLTGVDWTKIRIIKDDTGTDGYVLGP